MCGVHVFIAVCKWVNTCDMCTEIENNIGIGPYCQFCVSLLLTAVYQASKFLEMFPSLPFSLGGRPKALQTMDYYSIRILCELVDPNSVCQPCEASTLPNTPGYIQCLYKSGVIHILAGP